MRSASVSEDFDLVLASAVESTPDPPSAATELDGVTLLTVLASFAGVGPYDPTDPVRERQQAILQIDPASPVLRSFPWAWWRGGTPMGQFVFTGRTLDPAHTVVADLWFDPD